MKKEYDFSKGVRGKFYKKKIQKTIRFDEDVLRFFMNLGEEEGIPYQTLINLTLRKFAVEDGVILISAHSKPRKNAS